MTLSAPKKSGINSGALEVPPEKIQAEYQDTLRSTIKYELISGGQPDFANFFQKYFSLKVYLEIVGKIWWASTDQIIFYYRS